MAEAGTSPCGNTAGARPEPARARGRLGAEGRETLRRTVQEAVIPALSGTRKPAPGPDWAARIAEATRLSLVDDDNALAAFVDGLHRAGETAATLYDALLTPVARELGVMWEQDTCTFADLTVGVMRLQRAQRDLSPAFRGDRRPVPHRRILLMPVPGEQHVFGLSIVADHFAHAGWDAQVATPATARAACRLARRCRTDLVGLSLASDDRLDDAASLVAALRRDLPGIRVLAGGPSVVARPDVVARIGADAGAGTGQQAVQWANAMLGTAARD